MARTMRGAGRLSDPRSTHAVFDCNQPLTLLVSQYILLRARYPYHDLTVCITFRGLKSSTRLRHELASPLCSQ